MARRTPSTQILFFAGNTPVDARILSEQSDVTRFIPLAIPRNRYASISFVASMTRSFFVALWTLLRNRPTHVISSGGILSLPVVLAAFILRIPRELYELNATPGRATTLLAPLCSTIHCCFPSTIKQLPRRWQHRARTTDYPLRSWPAHALTRTAARAQLSIPTGKKVLMVIGGGQGSQQLNTIVRTALEACPELQRQLHLIHQTGAEQRDTFAAWYQKQGISADVFTYRSDPSHCYRAANMIICRAGAGTLFEVTQLDIPFITIPLQTATTSHQKDNAQAIQALHPQRCFVMAQDEALEDHKIVSHTILKQLDIGT